MVEISAPLECAALAAAEKSRFSYEECLSRVEWMQRIGYPMHQIEQVLDVLAKGIWVPLDGLPMIDAALDE